MSNISVSITADTAQLESRFAVARAEAQALTREFNALAKQAAAAGSFDEMKTQLDAAAQKMLEAKNNAAQLRAELQTGQDSFGRYTQAASLAKEALGALGVVASVGALVQFGRTVFESAAEIQHESEVLGLSTDAYQAFTKGAAYLVSQPMW